MDVQVQQNIGAALPASKSARFSLDVAEATRLTDQLLDSTRTLMNGTHHHIIAYSGGIDSSVVAALIHKCKIPNSQETATAVLGISAAVPSDQISLAEQVAAIIGISLEKIPTTEGTDETYIENNGQACLACKTHLYSCLESIVDHAAGRRLYNGTNTDDLQDPTRLGLIAADRFQVKSPLRNTTKEQVRIVGRHLGLPNWNHAASPCLRSRLAIGVEAIPQHLQRIEAAETYVRGQLGLNATNNLRVRLFSKGRAMVEVEDVYLERAELALEDWKDFFQHELNFASVGIRCFKSGSVAKVVKPSYSAKLRC